MSSGTPEADGADTLMDWVVVEAAPPGHVAVNVMV
jgi:hypothetical protein